MVTVLQSESLKAGLLAPAGSIPLTNFQPDHQFSTCRRLVAGWRAAQAVKKQPIKKAAPIENKQFFITESGRSFLMHRIIKQIPSPGFFSHTAPAEGWQAQ